MDLLILKYSIFFSHLTKQKRIYIYIKLNNLLNNSTYGKGKKPARNSKIKIYNESLSRGNIYIYLLEKKEKTNLVIPIEKNQQIHRNCS